MLTIIVKGTNGCNLACSYCSLGKKNHVQMMDGDMLYDMMKYSCELCIHQSERELCFIFHGGEPTLIPCRDYDAAMQKIKQEYKDLSIKFSMQTNGYHITEEWIAFFLKNHMTVGVSIDGGAAIHDKERTTLKGDATFEIVQKNISRLLNAGVGVACLMVLTSNACKEDFGFLKYYEEQGLHLKINPLLDYGEVYDNPELSLQSGQYADYLIRLYEHCLENDIDVTISPIDKLVQGILSDDKKIRTCSFDKKCSEHFLCIDYKGDIYPCGKFSDLGEFCLGTIRDKNYEIFQSPIIQKLLARRKQCRPARCKQCKYAELCNAGCNAEACISGALADEPAMCRDYAMLFEYFSGKGLRLLKEELLRQRKNLVTRGNQ